MVTTFLVSQETKPTPLAFMVTTTPIGKHPRPSGKWREWGQEMGRAFNSPTQFPSPSG
jgi:hypothetical protein